ncbi:hypothetical protein BDQ17DRAFT_1419101 [Cyathus striatus]|nr:hypothetical protein BDQ17DRAFT_1419101 [Cyathus striatus]
MVDNNANIPTNPTNPMRAQSAPPREHPLDPNAAPRINQRVAVSLTRSTPRSKDFGNHSDHHSGPVSKADDTTGRNREAFDQWHATHFAYDHPGKDRERGTIEEFLKKFVPSPVTVPSNPVLEQELFSLAKNIPMVVEPTTYVPTITLLDKCQEDMDDDKKINFGDTSRVKLPGPTEYDHFTGPDILGPYPGRPAITSNHSWDKYCIAIEAKIHSDPVDQTPANIPAFKHNVDTLAQLVKNGRNLLFASSSCYVFVIGIYCGTRQIRIHRFDHSGSVSCGFDYFNKPHIIREFLWRLVNPHHGIPNTIVGWDETIRIPSDKDIQKMTRIIKPSYGWLTINKQDCKWLKIRVNRESFKSRMNDTSLPSSVNDSADDPVDSMDGSSLSSSNGLSDDLADSRAVSSSPSSDNQTDSNLDLAFGSSPLSSLESSDGVPVSLPSPSNSSSHSLAKPIPQENSYYDLEGITFGPPLYKSSGLVSRATYVTRILVEIPGQGYHVFVLKDSWHQLIRKPESDYYERIQQRFPELKMQPRFAWVKEIYPDIDSKPNWIPGLAEYYGYLDLSSISPKDAEIRGHTTATRRLLKGDPLSERGRGRSLTGPVGGYIADFRSTKDLVTVIRDAVIGHFIARSCGVLHRDISDGNILVGNISGQLRGFLHDFDYATFIECDLDTPQDKIAVRSRIEDLKILTGTPQFMAIDILAKQQHLPHHDLESFYWVMVWILLRYGQHQHVEGSQACTNLFDHASDSVARTFKHSWVKEYDEPLTMQSNVPLSTLMKYLRRIFERYHRKKKEETIPQHEKFAKGLDIMIKSEGWPNDDQRVNYSGSSQLQADKYTFHKKDSSHSAPRRSERIAIANAQEGIIPSEGIALGSNVPTSTNVTPLDDLEGASVGSSDSGLSALSRPLVPNAKQKDQDVEAPPSWLFQSRKRRKSLADEEHINKKSRSEQSSWHPDDDAE